jgi:hypothetical protein
MMPRASAHRIRPLLQSCNTARDHIKSRWFGIIATFKRSGDYVIPWLIPMWIFLGMTYAVDAENFRGCHILSNWSWKLSQILAALATRGILFARRLPPVGTEFHDEHGCWAKRRVFA